MGCGAEATRPLSCCFTDRANHWAEGSKLTSTGSKWRRASDDTHNTYEYNASPVRKKVRTRWKQLCLTLWSILFPILVAGSISDVISWHNCASDRLMGPSFESFPSQSVTAYRWVMASADVGDSPSNPLL